MGDYLSIMIRLANQLRIKRSQAIRFLSRVLNLPPRPSLILLKFLEKRPIVAVEVGVSIGNNAQHMLSRIPQIKKLYLVDPYRYADDLKDQHRIHGDLSKYKLTAKENLKPFKDRTVFVYEPFSSEVIPEKVDFIYIDGDHSTQAVISDIEESFKILNKNGMIAGHDIHYDSVRRGVETIFGANYHRFCYDWWVKPSLIHR